MLRIWYCGSQRLRMYFRSVKHTGMGKGGDFKTKTQITAHIQGKVSLKKRKLRQRTTHQGVRIPFPLPTLLSSTQKDVIGSLSHPVLQEHFTMTSSATGHVCTSTAAGIRSVLLQKLPSVPTNCTSAGLTHWHHSATIHEHAFLLHSRCKQTVNHWHTGLESMWNKSFWGTPHQAFSTIVL